jgi:hypothetical protein
MSERNRGRLWVVEWQAPGGEWVVATESGHYAIQITRASAIASREAISAPLSPRPWRVVPYDRVARAK